MRTEYYFQVLAVIAMLLRALFGHGPRLGRVAGSGLWLGILYLGGFFDELLEDVVYWWTWERRKF